MGDIMFPDGGKAHFKSRISFYFVSKLHSLFRMYMHICGNLYIHRNIIFVDFCPSEHLIDGINSVLLHGSYCMPCNIRSKSYPTMKLAICLCFGSYGK